MIPTDFQKLVSVRECEPSRGVKERLVKNRRIEGQIDGTSSEKKKGRFQDVYKL